MTRPRPLILTTSWDDGHPLDFRIAELLLSHGLRGTFYIPRTAPTGVMRESDVRRLSELSPASIEIGAHTIDHVFLTEVDQPRARREIAGSKSWVEETTARPCRVFCPPAGKFNSRHVRMIADAGYEGFRTVELLSFDAPRATRGRPVKELPTTIHAFPHTFTSYARNAVKRRAPGNFIHYLACHGNGDWLALAEAMLDRATRRGGVFHLWGHSWEIEQTGQWARLEQLVKLMAEVARNANSAVNGELSTALSS